MQLAGEKEKLAQEKENLAQEKEKLARENQTLAEEKEKLAKDKATAERNNAHHARLWHKSAAECNALCHNLKALAKEVLRSRPKQCKRVVSAAAKVNTVITPLCMQLSKEAALDSFAARLYTLVTASTQSLIN
eukprot:437836-Rhodomonas_salina.1